MELIVVGLIEEVVSSMMDIEGVGVDLFVSTVGRLVGIELITDGLIEEVFDINLVGLTVSVELFDIDGLDVAFTNITPSC